MATPQAGVGSTTLTHHLHPSPSRTLLGNEQTAGFLRWHHTLAGTYGLQWTSVDHPGKGTNFRMAWLRDKYQKSLWARYQGGAACYNSETVAWIVFKLNRNEKCRFKNVSRWPAVIYLTSKLPINVRYKSRYSSYPMARINHATEFTIEQRFF